MVSVGLVRCEMENDVTGFNEFHIQTFKMIAGIYLMGILQGVILLGIVASKSRFKTTSSIFLGGLIFISSALVLGQLLISMNRHDDLPLLFLLITGLPLLVGPHLYFYIQSKFGRDVSYLMMTLHHLPFLGYVCLLIVTLFLEFSGDLGRFITASTISTDSPQNQTFFSVGLIKAVHLLGYTIAAVAVLWKNNLGGKKSLQSILFVFAIGQIVLWVLMLQQAASVDDVFILFQIVLLYFIGYQSILNKDAIVAKKKYEGSRLKKEDMESAFQQMKDKIIAGKLYLNPDFSLKDLSTLTGKNEHQTSQIINQMTGENFSVLINTMRVEHAISLIQGAKYQHMKLLAIAFESGFKNKNSFNQHFKRVTGTTPSAFKSSLRQEED